MPEAGHEPAHHGRFMYRNPFYTPKLCQEGLISQLGKASGRRIYDARGHVQVYLISGFRTGRSR